VFRAHERPISCPKVWALRSAVARNALTQERDAVGDNRSYPSPRVRQRSDVEALRPTHSRACRQSRARLRMWKTPSVHAYSQPLTLGCVRQNQRVFEHFGESFGESHGSVSTLRLSWISSNEITHTRYEAHHLFLIVLRVFSMSGVVSQAEPCGHIFLFEF
jgi:hypothetical protein